MPEPLKFVDDDHLITGWDFSTSGAKCLAFTPSGEVVARVHLPTDLWRGDPVKKGLSELNLMQLEGQAYATVRALVPQLGKRALRWIAGGISATHHTAGRIDARAVQVRRAICWNDATLEDYQRLGLERLGGPDRVRELIGGPWAIRYTLSHLVKDEAALKPEEWTRTRRILPHGALAAGYLTGNFDVASVSVGASTGIMDLRAAKWRREMLDALETAEYRELAWHQLPRIVDQYEPIGPLADWVARSAGLGGKPRPLIFPTSDDQQAGLIGGGAVEAGQIAVVLGKSAVVNSAFDAIPERTQLDVMRLNWGPYLLMRCYNNGAQLLDKIVGEKPNWEKLEAEARRCPPGCGGVHVRPFAQPEPSMGVSKERAKIEWAPAKPGARGMQFRAALEAIAYLIDRGVKEHEAAGQKIERITVSGGIARSRLMCEILATVLERRIELLESDEGPALGAAVTALAAIESNLRRANGVRRRFTAADAVAAMVRFVEPVDPNPEWIGPYRAARRRFDDDLGTIGAS